MPILSFLLCDDKTVYSYLLGAQINHVFRQCASCPVFSSEDTNSHTSN